MNGKTVLLVIVLLSLGFVSPAVAQTGLVSTPGTKVTSIVPHGFTIDNGPFSYLTSPSDFTFNATKNDYLRLILPTVGPTALTNTLVWYNTTYTTWQMATGANTINVYFNPNQYQARLLIQANLATAQSLCLPFVAPSAITRQTFNGTLLPSVKAGSEIFDWSDIPAIYAPTWNVNKLCVSLPVGVTNIDPLALDGADICSATATSCTLTITTISSPDVIIISCGVPIAGAGATHCTLPTAPGLTFAFRASNALSTTNNVTEWYAIANSPLNAEIFTCHLSASTNFGCNGFGVSGADTTTIWDSNAAIPAKATGTASIPTVSTVTTSNANDILIGMTEDKGTVVQTAGTCAAVTCTLIHSTTVAPIVATEYLIVSATQSSATVAFGTSTGATNTWTMMADAIIAKPTPATSVGASPNFSWLLLLPFMMIAIILLSTRRR